MLHPDTGEPAGVLCLCFNFDQEMAAIFDAYRDPSQRANMLLLDAHNHVISSADPLWIPAGVKVPVNPEGAARLLMFGGREYLVRTFSSDGYQGYPGPAGWKGQLMMPVDLAFRHDGTDALAGVDPQLIKGLLSHAEAFSPSLHELMSSVTRTTRTIERIVWNGKVTSAAGDQTSGHQHHSGTRISHTICSWPALQFMSPMPNSSRKISPNATGTTTARRLAARCWFSNWPPQLMR